MRHLFTPRPRAVLAVLALCLGLAGCAAQNAYRDGEARFAEGQLPQALERFETALRLEPDSARYRIAYKNTRDRLVDQALSRAAAARVQGDLAGAEGEYRKALALNGADGRALQGLRQLDQQRRWDAQIKDAEGALARKDVEGTRARLKPLLLENPNHLRAQELLRQADAAARAQAEAAPPAAAASAVAPPPASAAAPEKALAQAYRKPISIEFRDTTIKSAFDVIARTSGLNFVFDKDVKLDQRTSIYLRNSTIEAAVTWMLMTNQLESRVLDGNSVLIYPNTPAKSKEYQSLTVRSFYIANGDAKTVAATLKSLLKVRDAVVDERLNLVIVRDSPEVIRMAEKVVALQDMAEPEVMLEVEILEVKRTNLTNLGIQWPDQLSLSPLPLTNGSNLTLSDLRRLNSSSIGAAIGSTSINARKADSDTNVLANPRIRTRNREKAKIHIGERVPNITATSTSTGFLAESISYVDVGLKLDVEPTIYLDNEVAIRISLEVSNIIQQVPTKSGSVAYQIGTRTASTILRLKDGENQVLAGLINDEDRRSANKVPGLGEVPVVGRLFGQQSDDSSKSEIVLSITPRVLRNLERPDAALQEFDSGTESGGRPPEGGTGGAARAAAPVAPAAPPATPARPASNTPASSTAPAATSPTANAAPAPTMATDTMGTTGTNGTSGTTGTNGTNGTSSGGTLLPAAAPSQGTVALRWVGPVSARVGDTFGVQIIVSADQAVTTLPLGLSFDPKVLQLEAVNEGVYFKQGGATSSFTSQVDPRGQVQVNAARSGGGTVQLASSLVVLTFKALASTGDARTAIQLLNAAPTGSTGQAMVAQLPAPLTIAIQP